jgi:dihydrodipicolinate synthase/N-acetylneuraminate lyase
VGGALNTRNSVHLARHAEKLAADGVSSIPPTYYLYKFSEIFDYYRMIAESTGLPFFIYYIPGTTGVVLVNEQIAKLQIVKNIRGLKYTHPDLHGLQDLLLRTEGKWIAFSGPDELFLPALTMGVAGSIGSTQNVLPEIFVGIYRNFQAGNLTEAMRLQRRITAAVTLMKKYGGVAAWKTALRFRGIDAGLGRRPLQPEFPAAERKGFAREWKNAFPDFSEDL